MDFKKIIEEKAVVFISEKEIDKGRVVKYKELYIDGRYL